MAANGNITLRGRLTKDAVLEKTEKGLCILSFGILCQMTRTGEPEFFLIKRFGPDAEAGAAYLKKGLQVTVAGRIHARSWQEEGRRMYGVEIIADEVCADIGAGFAETFGSVQTQTQAQTGTLYAAVEAAHAKAAAKIANGAQTQIQSGTQVRAQAQPQEKPAAQQPAKKQGMTVTDGGLSKPAQHGNMSIPDTIDDSLDAMLLSADD